MHCITHRSATESGRDVGLRFSTCCRSVSWKSLKGFTLIELTVVIGIIALLAALLMPALRRAKEYSMASQCASNLRQIYVAFGAFAADHNDFFPWTDRWWSCLGYGTDDSFATYYSNIANPNGGYLG